MMSTTPIGGITNGWSSPTTISGPLIVITNQFGETLFGPGNHVVDPMRWQQVIVRVERSATEAVFVRPAPRRRRPTWTIAEGRGEYVVGLEIAVHDERVAAWPVLLGRHVSRRANQARRRRRIVRERIEQQ